MSKGGIILKKQEMTSLWLEGKYTPVTILKLVPQEIIRFKTDEKDGYNAVIIGLGKKHFPNKEKGVKEKYSYVTEFKVTSNYINDHKIGDNFDLDLLDGNTNVKIQAISKGKGYQGVVRRFKFAGGPETHGSKFHRLPGSIGNRKPRRVNKGHPLPGHMGLDKITLKNVKIIEILKVNEDKLLLIKGSIPGFYNSLVKVFID